MTDNFDPYHVWFGIPPEEQPPNYYRLLGIRLFETNADAIDNMADQRMTHLRGLQTGKHSRLSQKLLNEVAAARLCLLNSTTRQQYDAKLRTALGAAMPPAATTTVPPSAEVAVVPRDVPRRAAAEIAATPTFFDSAAPTPLRKSAPRPSQSLAGPMIGGGIALFAVIAAGVGYYVATQGGSTPDGNGDPPAVVRNNAPVEIQHPPRPSLPDSRPANPPPGMISGTTPVELALHFQWPIAERQGAELTIDGQVKPLAAADLVFPLPQGLHQVRIVRPGFRPVAQMVFMTPAGCPPIVPFWVPANNAPAVVESNPPPQAGPPLPSGRVVDLLALVDPRRNAFRGQWRKEGGALISDRGQPTILSIPYAPPDEYQITMVAERIEGDDAITLGLISAGHCFTAGVDNFSERGGITGIELIDRHRIYENTARYNGKVLVNGTPSTIKMTVAKNRFTLVHDQETLVDWRDADYRRCSLVFFYHGVDETKLFLGAWNSVYRISRLELTPLGATPAPTAVAEQPIPGVPHDARSSPAPVPAPTPTPAPTVDNKTPPVGPADKEKPDTKVAKLAVPDEAAQAKESKTIQDVYHDQIKGAASSEQKLALAKKLRDDGLATRDDPTAKFVMLKMARDLAAAQGDLDTATEIIDKLAEQFEVDPLVMKGEMFFAAVKGPQHPDDLPAKLNSFADDAVAADRYDLAKRAMTAALTLKGDPAARKQTIAHQKEIAATEVEFNKLKNSLEALAANPDDPEANLAVGRFDCLVKGNFDAGLPLLAKGSDKALSNLAKLDLAKSADPAEQIKVADGWWETAKKPARLRAKEIYESALPNLSGIAKVRIEKRLQEFETKPLTVGPAAETWTNLLTLVDADKNAVRGKWTNGKDGLQCTEAGFGNSIMVPQDPGSSYELRMEFTRLTGNSEIMLMLPVNGTHCRLILGAFGRSGGGIDMIDGKDIQSNPTGRPARLENNKKVAVDVVVRNNAKGIEILVRVNGTDFTAFRGPASQLTGLPFGIRLPNEKWLALGSQNSTAVFSSLQYRKLSK